MTAHLTKTIRKAGIVAAFVLSFSAISTSSFAFSAESKRMCMGDVFSLCGSEVPNVSRVTACMIARRASASPGCKQAMNRELGSRARKIASK